MVTQLNDAQQTFLDKRRKLIRTWPWIGMTLLVCVLSTLLWLWFYQPILVNPYEVIERLHSGGIGNSTLALMAAMLPLLALVCFFLTTVVILYTYAAFSNEKRHINIIDTLTSKGVDQDGITDSNLPVE